MKKLISTMAILIGLATSAQAEHNYKEWTKFIDKVWDCKAEIQEAGKFTGCSGFSLDYMHLMDGEAVDWLDAPEKYQHKIQKIMGIDPENPQPGQEKEIINGVMPVALDFMCESPEGKAWIVSEMASGVKDETSMAGTLIALSMMNSIFCNQPADTDYSALFSNL